MNNRNDFKWLVLIGMVGVMPEVAYAHGFVKYVCNPIFPAIEFLFVRYFYILAFLTANIYLLRLAKFSWTASIFKSMAMLVCFIFIFMNLGMLKYDFTPATPSIGGPCMAYFGLDWHETISYFIKWNIYALLILMFSVIMILKAWKHYERVKKIIFMNIYIYIFALLPFFISGAFLHGWAGVYTGWECFGRTGDIHVGIRGYAKSHDSRLPTAVNIQELISAIKPYLDDDAKDIQNLDVCPIAAAFEKNPMKYIWNPQFSGKPISVMCDEKMNLVNDPITCPYHK